jgi:hypothetical protein
MARGLPVIGSAVPGIRELLPDDLLFDPKRPAAIVRLIEGFLHQNRYRRAAQLCARRATDFAPGRLSAARRALLSSLRAIAVRAPRATACPTESLEVVPALPNSPI